MSDREVVIVDDVAGAAAERIAAAVRAGGHIALSGGSTPRKAHEKVAAMGLDWSGWSCGSATTARCRRTTSTPTTGWRRRACSTTCRCAEVHRIQGELGYQAAADDYEARAARLRSARACPSLDLVLLGLGPDAHTASLFPGDDALGERERLAVGVETPGMAPLVSRVTLTLPVLNAGKEVVFLISGEDKAEAVAARVRRRARTPTLRPAWCARRPGT